MLAVGRWSHQSCCEIGQSIQGQLAKETWVTGKIGEVVENLRWKGVNISDTFFVFGEEVLHWFTKTFGYEASYDVQLGISLGTSLPEFLAFVASPFRTTEPDGRLWVWWAKQLFLCREYWLNQGDWTVKSRIGMDEWQLQISSSLGWGEGYWCCVPSNLCSSNMYIISRIHYIRIYSACKWLLNAFSLHSSFFSEVFTTSMKFTKWRAWNLRTGGAGMVFGSWNLEILRILWGRKPGRYETYQFKTEKRGVYEPCSLNICVYMQCIFNIQLLI